MNTKQHSAKKSLVAYTLCFLLLMGFYLIAGNLEPSAAPGPTMFTLEEIYQRPVWPMLNKTFVDWPSNPRFAVCDEGTTENLSDDMVLDKETGLIWSRDANYFGTDKEWADAILACRNEVTLGQRKGWRMCAIEEICSLLDMSQTSPALPSGHPFINVQGGYWSATTHATQNDRIYSVALGINGHVGDLPKTGPWPGVWAWPVRGGVGVYNNY